MALSVLRQVVGMLRRSSAVAQLLSVRQHHCILDHATKTDAMWDVLDFIIDFLGSFPECWRFCVCLLGSFAGAAVCFWLIPDRGLWLGLSALLFIAGAGIGIVWQTRAR